MTSLTHTLQDSPRMMSSEISSPDLLAPHEIIFSCAICQRTISELYKRPQTDHGFSSGGHEERVVTRLWLAECGHLTCSDHLEGGGVPFHPQGKQPSAPCPYCVAENDDSTPRLLYFITGRGRDEHDKNIPAEYFQIPPSILSADSSAASALRFQYLSLLRFSGMMAKRCKELERAANVAEAKVQDLTTSLQDTRKESADLRLQIDELREFERKYLAYKKREPEIRYFLGNVVGLTNENTQMRRQLRQLGYDVPRTKYSMDVEKEKALEPTASKTTDLNGHVDQHHHESSSSVMKRPREVFLEDTIDEPNGNHFNAYKSMPPPPKPQHRQQKQGVELYSGGGWRNTHSSDEGFASAVQPPPQPQQQYMMSGALRTQQKQTNGSTPRPKHKSQNVRSDKMDELLALSLPQRGQTEQRYSTGDAAYYDAPVEQPAPPSDDVTMPPMRRSFASAVAPNSLHYGEPNFNQVDNSHITHPRLLSRDPRAQVGTESVDHGRTRTTSSPFFYDAAQAPVKANQPRVVIPPMSHQADQLLPDLDGMGMDVDFEKPPKTHSLNDLSFIQQPYTRSNKPVYSRPASRTIWSRAAPNAQAQQYAMPAVQNRAYLPELRPPAPRAPMAPPPVPASRQIPSRSIGLQYEGGFSRFAKSSSLKASTYNASSNQTRFPFQQRSGVNTGNALRSVRR